jgi:hypothetical protein
MMKTLGKITLASILAAVMVGMPARLMADDSATTTNKPAKSHASGSRFFGKVSAIDTTAKTITVENKTMPKRTFEISSETKIMKDGKPATLSDGVVGEDVGGTFATGADGKMTAKTVRFGKPTAPAKKPAPATPPPSN